MLKTGDQHLESLRDGRTIYIGKEKVTDVTTHPAFCNAARSMAAIYDMKAAPENRDAMSFEEGGKHFSTYFLKPKSRGDLEARSLAHRRIAEMSYGMLGRSPDHVASFVTGMATKPEEFGRFAGNLTAYYEHMRDNDIYAAYAVLPPQAARNPDFYHRQNIPVPTIAVIVPS